MINDIGDGGGALYRYTVLVGFLLLVIGAGTYIGLATAPDGWYLELDKPSFNPPNWVFAPAWLTLYVLIAVAGWRVWLSAPRGPAMALWWGQLALNWLWSPTFFSLHQVWAAFAVILVLWLLIIAFIARVRVTDKLAAWLFAPYLAWVSFAAILNLSIGVLN